MKLQMPNWKTAWHDQHLSERFLKEWNRMEAGPLRDLAGTSGWMDQLVIELGQLAQSMMHLEESQTHASHLRLAAERSLKLSALAARLAGALDATYRRNTTEVPEFLSNGLGVASPSEGGAFDGAAAPPPPAAPPSNGPSRAAPAAGGPVATPTVASTALPPRPPTYTALQGPTAAQQAPAAPASNGQGGTAPAAEVAPAAPRTDRSQAFLVQARDPRMLMQPRKAPAISPEQERLVLAGPQRSLETEHRASERPMTLTIKSLSDRGLSLDEIELVTGQPRSTIETVLSAH